MVATVHMEYTRLSGLYHTKCIVIVWFAPGYLMKGYQRLEGLVAQFKSVPEDAKHAWRTLLLSP